MKTVWKIWDNYNSKMLEGNYESKDKAEEAKRRKSDILCDQNLEKYL